jgi:hypothetical protein
MIIVQHFQFCLTKLDDENDLEADAGLQDDEVETAQK